MISNFGIRELNDRDLELRKVDGRLPQEFPFGGGRRGKELLARRGFVRQSGRPAVRRVDPEAGVGRAGAENRFR